MIDEKTFTLFCLQEINALRNDIKKSLADNSDKLDPFALIMLGKIQSYENLLSTFNYDEMLKDGKNIEDEDDEAIECDEQRVISKIHNTIQGLYNRRNYMTFSSYESAVDGYRMALGIVMRQIYRLTAEDFDFENITDNLTDDFQEGDYIDYLELGDPEGAEAYLKSHQKRN